jgi:hypothetical protein
VALTTPDDPPILMKSEGYASLCLEDTYTLESFYVINMNQFLNDDRSALDSDADGLNDAEEIEMGFDPKLRRSNKLVLDRICYDQFGSFEACEQIDIVCTKKSVGFGFTDCDLIALGLNEVAGRKKGMDSDGDGILDAIELLRGTLPLRADAMEDPDHDQILNRDEIAKGTNPNSYFINSPLDLVVQSSAAMVSQSSNACPGETWKLNLDQVPVFAINEFTSETEPEFSHKKNENIVWVFAHLKANVGNKSPKILFSRFVLDKLIDKKFLTNADFKTFLPVEGE